MIQVSNLTKIFTLPEQRFLRFFNHSKNQKIVALDNVSFEINKGETVGLIGKNGSGKTTLLKILAGIFEPTQGIVKIYGQKAPYLSLNVGLHQELTAKENIYLYGSIFSFSKKEIKTKIDEILSFAELSDFQNTKLKYFSSGMIARLIFSLIIQIKSDILLLDEILAVGDKDFVPKCIAKIKELQKQEKTIIIASHQLNLIKSLCPKTIFLHQGKLIMYDRTEKVIENYLQY